MNIYLAIHLCAGLLCAPYENPMPYATMTDCARAARETVAHVKVEPDAYRSMLSDAPGEIRVDAYACVWRVE